MLWAAAQLPCTAARLTDRCDIQQLHAVLDAAVLLCRLLLGLADVEQENSNWAQVIQLAQAASRAAQDAEVVVLDSGSHRCFVQWHHS